MPVVYDDQERDALNDERNPGQAHYDDQFANITNPENYGQDGSEPGISDAERGEFDSLTSPGHQSLDGGQNRGGLYNSGGEQANTKQVAAGSNENNTSFLGGLRGKYGQAKGKMGSLLKKKWLVGAGLGGASVAGLLLLLLILMSSFKIPHLMENITTYQFARVFQQAARQDDRTFGAKIAVSVAEHPTYLKYQEKYATKATAVKTTWEKLDKFRPNKVIANLNSDGMVFNYDQKGKLAGITLGDKTILSPKPLSAGQRLIPGYKFANDVEKWRRFAPELSDATGSQKAGTFVRGIIGNKLRKQLGISFAAWVVGEYKGKTKQEVARSVFKDSAETAANDGGEEPRTSNLKEQTNAAKEAEAAGRASPSQVDAALKNGGVFKATQQAVAKVAQTSGFETAIGIVNPLYTIVTPICIVYDGSTSNAEQSINSNSEAQIRSYNHLATVADQQKDGLSANAEVVGAYNDKIGNPNNTAPLNVANGKPAGTVGGISPQTGPGGSFTAFDAIFGGNSSAGNVANAIADKICPSLTDPKVAAAVAAGNLIVLLGSGFTAGGVEEVAGQAATRVITKIGEKEVARFGITNIKAQSSRAGKFLGKQVLFAGGIAATTIVAKQIVATSAGAYNNGTEDKADYVATVDSGANLEANELSRQQQFGRPLNETETKVAVADSSAFVAAENKSKSTFDRYLAVSNPSSLVTRFGLAMSGSTSSKVLSSLLNPIASFSKVLASLNPAAHAATVGYGNTYDNIQWGWSKEELQYVAKHDDFEMLENQLILENSGKRDEIAGHYAKCFSGDHKIGELIKNELIVRDEDGHVLNSNNIDACSPNNLSFQNPVYGDLVLRWRVAQADNTDLDEKANLQVVAEPAVDTPQTGAGSDVVIASFNIFHNTAGTDYSRDWVNRLSRSVSVIKGNGITVAGLQEVRPDVLAKLQTKDFLGDAYGVFPTTNVGYGAQSPIIWDTSKYTKVDSGTKMIRGMTVTHGFDDKANVQVRLRDNVTGQEFTVINGHEPVGNVDRNGDHIKARYDGAVNLAKTIADLQKEPDAVPVFTTADYNAKYTVNNPNQRTYQNKKENLVYCLLTNNTGMWDAYDASKNLTGTCPSYDTQMPVGDGPRGPVDHVFLSSSVTVSKYDYSISHPGNGSDVHNTLIVHATIPGSGVSNAVDTSGADTGWSWPLAKNDWTGPFGYNVWGTCAIKCRHAGIDLSGTAGDQVLAAHDGTVQSVGYVILARGACKWQVVVKATGTPYYYAYQHMGSVAVKEGNVIKAGQKVGIVDKIGPTGDCGGGAHLHFSIEKSNKASAYGDGAGVCDVNQVSCAKQMTTLPPLCFLAADGRKLGTFVPGNQVKGSDYCKQLVNESGGTLNV